MSRPPRPHLAVDTVRFELPDGRLLLDVPRLGIGDERVGLVGPNGSGKSTLLRLLAGTLPPGTGRITRPGRVVLVRPTHVHPPGTTVEEALGLHDPLATRRMRQGALASLGLPGVTLDRDVADLSGGETVRLAIAAGTLADPDVLLIDEPTNDLDAESRGAVRAFVARWRRGLVVASHDRALLGAVDRIVAIEGGTLREYGGAWEAYQARVLEEREAVEREFGNAAAEAARARRQAQEVRERQARRDAAGRRTRDTGSQPKVVLNGRRERSQATGARLDAVVERSLEESERRLRAAKAMRHARAELVVEMPASGLPAGTTVISLDAVTAGPAPDVPLLRDVSFAIRGPERVAFTGPNGSGKSTLLRLVAGLATPLAGTVRRGVPLARVAFLDQRARILDAGATVADAFAAQHPALDAQSVRAALARFRFRADAALTPVAALSGGERMRAALACVMAGPVVPQCLVLDEPNNHLDLEHLEGLESALRAYDGAIVVASHDEAFLEAIGVERSEPVARWRA